MYPGQVVHCALDQVEYRPKLRLQTARSQYKERHSPPPHLCPGPGPPRRPWSLRRHCHCAQSRQSSVSSFSACRTFWCEGAKEEKSSGLRKTFFSATDTPDQYTDRTAAMLTGAAPLNCPRTAHRRPGDCGLAAPNGDVLRYTRPQGRVFTIVFRRLGSEYND